VPYKLHHQHVKSYLISCQTIRDVISKETPTLPQGTERPFQVNSQFAVNKESNTIIQTVCMHMCVCMVVI
jgi:hypothetical protein